MAARERGPLRHAGVRPAPGQDASLAPAAGGIGTRTIIHGAHSHRRQPARPPPDHPHPTAAPRLCRRSRCTIRPSSSSGPATRRPTSRTSAFATSRRRPPSSPTPPSTCRRSSPTVPRRPLSCRARGTTRTWRSSSPTTTTRCHVPRRRRARRGRHAARHAPRAAACQPLLPPAGVGDCHLRSRAARELPARRGRARADRAVRLLGRPREQRHPKVSRSSAPVRWRVRASSSSTPSGTTWTDGASAP